MNSPGPTRRVFLLAGLLASCSEEPAVGQKVMTPLTTRHFVGDIVEHPAFAGFGELLLPWADNARYFGTPLSQIGSLMPYHAHVDPGVVVGALNRLIDEVAAGRTIFYDLYTEREKRTDPGKESTGFFFLRGEPGAPFAIVCPGGGFSYIGSLHEGFPLAQKISDEGLNAFVLRYRLSEQRATEDLAAAIAYIHRSSGELAVNTKGYSLWGASAGARMVGNIALRGVSTYGVGELPDPATVVIAYTGDPTFSGRFPPTFVTVSADDPIASVATVEERVRNLRAAGVEVGYQRFENAGHGFGLGSGTDAEGWIDHALRFWRDRR